MSSRPCTRIAIAAVLLVALPSAGCGTRLRWHMARTPNDATVAAALNEAKGDDGLGSFAFTPEVPNVPEPVRLRPCCAFGADLRTRVGVLPIPLLTIGNIIGPDTVGPHKYDGGLLA